jgi:hypothetical protein
MLRICKTVRSAGEASTRENTKPYCVEDKRTSDESTNTRTTVDFGRGKWPNVEGNRRADETLATLKACAGASG